MKISKQQLEYLEWKEKLKDIVLEPGFYYYYDNINARFEVVSTDEESNSVLLFAVDENLQRKYEKKKTLHWAKKHLLKIKN